LMRGKAISQQWLVKKDSRYLEWGDNRYLTHKDNRYLAGSDNRYLSHRGRSLKLRGRP
jgi:hypothetical protein